MADIGVEIGSGKEEASRAVYRSVTSALDTLFKSDPKESEVFDLIPVRPVGENEKEIENIFDLKLIGLFPNLPPYIGR